MNRRSWTVGEAHSPSPSNRSATSPSSTVPATASPQDASGPITGSTRGRLGGKLDDGEGDRVGEKGSAVAAESSSTSISFHQVIPASSSRNLQTRPSVTSERYAASSPLLELGANAPSQLSSPLSFTTSPNPRFATFFQVEPPAPTPTPTPAPAPLPTILAPSLAPPSTDPEDLHSPIMATRQRNSHGLNLSATPVPASRRFPSLHSLADITPRGSYYAGFPSQESTSNVSTPIVAPQPLAVPKRKLSITSFENIRIDPREGNNPKYLLSPPLSPHPSLPIRSTSPAFPPPSNPSSQYAPSVSSPNSISGGSSIYSPDPRCGLAPSFAQTNLSPALSRPTSILSLQSETSNYSTIFSSIQHSSIYRSTHSRSYAGSTHDSISIRGISPAQYLRKTALRLILLAGAIVVLVRYFTKGTIKPKLREANLSTSSSTASDSGFDESASGKMTKEEIKHLEIFRNENLWAKPPKDELLTLFKLTQPTAKHQETIIFLHGLAQHRWDSPMPPQLASRFPSLRWVTPEAPRKEVYVRNNESVPAWFDMRQFPYDNAEDEDVPNLYLSVRQLNTVIRSEQKLLIDNLRAQGGMKSLPLSEQVHGALQNDKQDGEVGTNAEIEWASSKIVLAGFSQGSVMALLTGLTTKERLAGLIILSGFLPLRAQVSQLMYGLDRTTLPIFWGHGKSDRYLLYEDAVLSIELLQSIEPIDGQGGVGLTAIDFRGYPGLGHSWHPGEMVHVGDWLEKVLPSRRNPPASALASGTDGPKRGA